MTGSPIELSWTMQNINWHNWWQRQGLSSRWMRTTSVHWMPRPTRRRRSECSSPSPRRTRLVWWRRSQAWPPGLKNFVRGVLLIAIPLIVLSCLAVIIYGGLKYCHGDKWSWVAQCSTMTTKINQMISFAHFSDHRREGGSGEASKGGALQHGGWGRGRANFLF